MKKLTPLMFSLMLAFGIAGVANAQSAPANAQPAQQQGMAAEQASFTDEQVEKFAETQPAIEAIRADYSQRLLDVNDPERAAQLQNEAVEQMVETVTEAGLEVETYNRIALTLQSDPQLRERIESMLN